MWLSGRWHFRRFLLSILTPALPLCFTNLAHMDTATMFISLGAGLGLGAAAAWLFLRSKVQAAAERARFEAGNEISVLTERLANKDKLESESRQLRLDYEATLKDSIE